MRQNTFGWQQPATAPAIDSTMPITSATNDSGSLINILTALRTEDAEFSNTLRNRNYKRGDIVATADDLAQNMYVLVEGRVNLVCMNAKERRLVAATLEPGAIFGEGALDGALHPNIFAEARESVTLWTIPNTDARDMTVQYPILSWGLLQTYGERLAQVEDNLEDVAYKTLPERLAQLILEYGDYKDGLIKGISHQVLADHLGTYRETVSAILRDFKRQNLVKLGYRRIEVLDAEELSEVAGVWDW